MRYIVRSVDGAEYGPFTSEELRQLVRERRLGEGDFVRRQAGRTWSPFEKIAGLAEAADEVVDGVADQMTDGASLSAAPTIPIPSRNGEERRPLRPRLEAAAERLDAEEAADDSAAPLEIEPASTSAASNTAAMEAPPITPIDPDAPPRPRVPVDPARSENPFVAAGLPIDLLPDESIQFVLVQSFTDATRSSVLGSLLGHRARLVCTDRRAVVIHPGIGRSTMVVSWLDRVDQAGVQARTSLVRMVGGIICLLYAAYAVAASAAGGVALGALGIGGAAGTAILVGGLVIAGIAGLLGLLLVLTARARSVTVGDGIQFPCAAAGPWHLARIDEGRMRSVGMLPAQ